LWQGDGFKVVLFLPGGVPVLIGSVGTGEGDLHLREECLEGIDGGLDGGFIEGALLDVCRLPRIGGNKGFTSCVSQQGGQHIAGRLVVGGEMEC